MSGMAPVVDMFEAEPDDLAPATVLDFPPARTIQSLELRATVEPTLVAESTPIIEQAAALVVTDAATCLRGKQLFETLRSFEQAALAHFTPDCDLAHKLWKSLTDKRGAVVKPIEAARKALGDRVARWELEEERRAQAEQRERERLAAEEQDQAAKRAAKQALQAGDVEQAAEILTEARTAPRPSVPAAPSSIPVTAGTGKRKTWRAEIPDLDALITAIAARNDKGERTMKEFDAVIADALMPSLHRQATTLKGALGDRYPGTRGVEKASLAGR
jgi:hypothetical protein